MKIVGIDPGSNATGVAVYYSHERWAAKQFKDPLVAWGAIENEFEDEEVHVLIEMYRSAGHLTQTAKDTIGLVRFFELATKYYHTWCTTVVMRAEQARLSGRREAAELMGGTIESLEADKERKDAFSALAHCITYARSVK